MELQTIAGTHRNPWPGAEPRGPIDPERRTRLTVWFTPRDASHVAARAAAHHGALPVGSRSFESRAAFRARTASSADAVERLAAHCAAHGLAVVERHWRSAVISGRLHDLAAAFGAQIELRADANGSLFRHRRGSLHAPASLAPLIRGVFGLHEWPRSPRIDGQPQRDREPLGAAQIARHYAFPPERGAGQTIAIIAYATAYRADDFDRAMARQGIVRERPIVKPVGGERTAHAYETSADLECATDVQIAAALAPGARIVVYETTHDERGLLDAIRTAIFDEQEQPSVLSISYGFVERAWTHGALETLDELFIAAAALGISVFVASGDDGAAVDDHGLPHVLAPASSPFVVACGATRLHVDEFGTASESAWHRTGGGFGRAPVPVWQDAARAWAERNGLEPRRGLPDVAGQCDPGFIVILAGRELAMHGTSTIAPMWSALAARINEAAARRYGPNATIGFFTPLLYARAAEIMRPVTSGGNGYFTARAAWNPCTGLGVPDGRALASALLA